MDPGVPAPQGPAGACSGQGYIKEKQQESQRVHIQRGSEKSAATLIQLRRNKYLPQAERHLETLAEEQKCEGSVRAF